MEPRSSEDALTTGRSANDEPTLEAREIGRRSPETGAWLLRDVSFVLRSGECVAVAGPTGSGKTLLLRALALLDPLDTGGVLWRGEPVSAGDIPQFRSRVTYIHQRPVLYPGTVEENLRTPFRLRVHRERSLDWDRVLRLLGEVGRNGDFLEKADRDLSGGERQFVQVIRALLLEPSVLLLDEPTAALDALAASTVEGLLRSWLEESPRERAVVWVSHDERQRNRMATRTFKLGGGQEM